MTMTRNLQELSRRRDALVALAAAHRAALAENIQPWRQPLALADQGMAAVRAIARHPVWIAAAVAVLAALKPARVMPWLGRGMGAWRLLCRLRGR
jgi:hypothetical protein